MPPVVVLICIGLILGLLEAAQTTAGRFGWFWYLPFIPGVLGLMSVIGSVGDDEPPYGRSQWRRLADLLAKWRTDAAVRRVSDTRSTFRKAADAPLKLARFTLGGLWVMFGETLVFLLAVIAIAALFVIPALLLGWNP